MSREAIEEAIEVLEDASAEMLMETGDKNYYIEAIAVLRQALVDADDTSALVLADALEELDVQFSHTGLCGEAAVELRRLHEVNQDLLKALHEALETEQEPVAWRYKYPDGVWRFSNGERVNGSDPIKSQPLYTAPPKKQWVGLPESACAAMTLQQVSAMKYAELVLKEKNT